jgi:hypothetical protein
LIALTRTPSRSPIWAVAFVKLNSAALTDPPMVKSGAAVRPPAPMILTIAPPDFLRCGQAARVMRT